MFRRRFRAWHQLEENMYKVSQINFGECTVTLSTLAWENDREVDMDDVVLMQESGMNDEKGFITFEDDIFYFNGTHCVLQYGEYGNTESGTNGFGWNLNCPLGSFPYLGGAVKIGNIYENFDLIREQFDVK